MTLQTCIIQGIGVEGVEAPESNLERSVTLNVQRAQCVPLNVECRDCANPASRLDVEADEDTSTVLVPYSCSSVESSPPHPTPRDVGPRCVEIDSHPSLSGLVYM